MQISVTINQTFDDIGAFEDFAARIKAALSGFVKTSAIEAGGPNRGGATAPASNPAPARILETPPAPIADLNTGAASTAASATATAAPPVVVADAAPVAAEAPRRRGRPPKAAEPAPAAAEPTLPLGPAPAPAPAPATVNVPLSADVPTDLSDDAAYMIAFRPIGNEFISKYGPAAFGALISDFAKKTGVKVERPSQIAGADNRRAFLDFVAARNAG